MSIPGTDGVAVDGRYPMRTSFKATAAAVALATVAAAIGVAAGTVIGSDGSVDVADRMSGEFGPPDTVRLQATDTRAAVETSGKKKKPVVLHGSGSFRTVSSGDADSVTLICPSKYPVPLSAGLSTPEPGIVPGAIERSTSASGMFVGVINLSGSTLEWAPTAACAKGMKEAG